MKNNFSGLVLAGGLSSRMKQNKSELVYDKLPQYKVVYKLLEEFCDDVFISCKSGNEYPLPMLFDHADYEGSGPVAGLLSAFRFKNNAWLVVAVDYPLLRKNDIQNLLASRDEKKTATSLYNQMGFYEPLIALYEKSFYPFLLHEFQLGNHSLQKMLKVQDAVKVFPENEKVLRSIDTPEDFQRIKSNTP